MSINIHVYVGPYVSLRHRLAVETVTEERFGCPKCRKPRNDGAKFCSSCGGATETFSVTKKVEHRTDPYDLIDEDMMELGSDESDEGLIFLAPNLNNEALPRPFGIDAKYDDVSVRPIGPSEREEDMKWLSETYDSQLALLREHFDDVRVEWGVHHYFS